MEKILLPFIETDGNVEGSVGNDGNVESPVEDEVNVDGYEPVQESTDWNAVEDPDTADESESDESSDTKAGEIVRF